MAPIRQILSILLSSILALPVFAQGTSQTTPATSSAAPSAEQLQQLTAPIALYPDPLIAQILAASTYPSEVVEAEKWMQQNSSLKGDSLMSAVNAQPWDPSVKSLAQFPSVLSDMSKNLSWVSSLGDAYVNAPHDVMNAIQQLRKDAQSAGNLQSTEQQTVSTEGQTIIIQPAQPEVVYVPEYSPEIYGAGMVPYPGYTGWGVAASAVSFGVGVAVGAAVGGGWGWGWNSWGTNWHGGDVTFNRNTYVSRSNTFANRNANFNQVNRTDLNRNTVNRNSVNSAARSENLGNANLGAGTRQKSTQNFNPSGSGIQRERQSQAASRGFSGSGVSSGSHSGAFGGFSQGGSANLSSARGHSSFGGGGGARMGGGGGASRGGGRR